MDEQNYREETISLKQIIILLFGNIKRYVIIAILSLVLSFIIILIFNTLKQDYTSMFNFNVAGLSNNAYIDGSKFDCRDLITLEKLEKYKSEHEELKDIDMKEVYQKGGIINFEYKTIYVENETKVNDDDVDYKVDYSGYSITISRKYFNQEEAAVLVEAIANEPLEITKEMIENIVYDSNLQLFNSCTKYEDQISYLLQQKNYINNKLDELINEFGDVRITDGTYGNKQIINKTLSDLKVDFQKEIQTSNIDLLSTELAASGYILISSVDTKSTELMTKLEQYTKEKQSLQEQQEIIEKEKNELKSIVESLVALAGSSSTALQSLELDSYQNRITELIKSNSEIETKLQSLEKKIANISLILEIDYKTEEVEEETIKYYQESETSKKYYLYDADKLDSFKTRLNDAYEIIKNATEVLTMVSTNVSKDNCTVYFKQAGVVEKIEGISLIYTGLISVAVAIFLPMLVNCALAIVKTVDDANKEAKLQEEELKKE